MHYLHAMRVLTALFLILAAPAAAWDFSPTPVCTISHDTPEVAVRVTYDPARAEYAIRLTLAGRAWPPGPVFAIRFDGGRALTISTDRHRLSDGGTALTVTDTGFGNVLNGLQFNRMATALIDGDAVSVPLAGAAKPVEAFRACAQGLSA